MGSGGKKAGAGLKDLLALVSGFSLAYKQQRLFTQRIFRGPGDSEQRHARHHQGLIGALCRVHTTLHHTPHEGHLERK